METSIRNKCKAYTSLEQSKKLAEILPFESADIILTLEGNSELTSYPIMRNYSEFYNYLRIFELEEKYIKRTYIPAWSLAALLAVLDEPYLLKKFYTWSCYVFNPNNHRFISTDSAEPVDACYEMILKLHELKLL